MSDSDVITASGAVDPPPPTTGNNGESILFPFSPYIIINLTLDEQQQQQQQQQQQPRTWSMIKSLVMRALFFYFIMSMFRKQPTKTPPDSGAGGGSGVNMPSHGSNLYPNGTHMDLFLYINENKYGPDFDDSSQLVWFKPDLIYGDWLSGPTGNGEYIEQVNVNLSPNVQNNGSLWLHIIVVPNGASPNAKDRDNHNPVYTIQKSKQLNRYKKRSYKKTHNLLTGQTAATEEEQAKIKQNIRHEILSHWHPNLTINLIDDHTPWTRGQVPAPLQEYIEFEPISGKYYPIIYINDYWNLMRDYQPINETVSNITFRFTYQPLSLFKWQMYTAQSMRNKWTSLMGHDANEQDDDEQDLLKETFLETSPILLGLTVVVSITHSVFEFLAFKNGNAHITMITIDRLTCFFVRHTILAKSSFTRRAFRSIRILQRISIAHCIAVCMRQ